jgi:hypothetical protein
MSNENDFHLVLASNVAPKTFPNNKPNNFYTPLSKALVFEEGEPWSVALKEITYHNTLLSIVNESIEVWKIFSNVNDWNLLDTLVIDTNNLSSMQMTQKEEIIFNSKLLMATLREGSCTVCFDIELSTPFLNTFGEFYVEIETPTVKGFGFDVTDLNFNFTYLIEDRRLTTVNVYGKRSSHLLHSAKPTSKNYGSPESLCKELNRVLLSTNVSFVIDEDNKHFRVASIPKNVKLILKDGMNYVMGYKKNELKNIGDTAEFRADLKRGTTGMMIYCSLCKFTLVGDSQVPLLRIAHIPHNIEHGAVINQIFNPPIYIPIALGGIVNTIEVDLRTDSGEEFPLSHDGKVLLTLHFQKCINN